MELLDRAKRSRWDCVCLWSLLILVYVSYIPGCHGDVQSCHISPLSLPVDSTVSAYYETNSHISGCSAESTTSVVAYVLSLKSAGLSVNHSQQQRVILNIDATFTHFKSSTPLVFVLSSADAVSWDIRSKTLSTLPRIVVSRPSTVSSSTDVDETVVDDLPIEQDALQQWVTNFYPIVTFAEFQQANHISILLDQDSHINSTCVVSDDWQQNEISAKFVEDMLITGCVLPDNSKELSEEVYVVELHHTNKSGHLAEAVNVNLRAVIQDIYTHNVVLVLKSNNPSITWNVHSTSVAGTLNIESDGDVYSENTMFDHVKMNRKSRGATGEGLVALLEEEYGGIIHYLLLDVANRIEITLEAPEIPRRPTFLNQDSSLIVKGNSLLEQIIDVQCLEQSMVVAIPLDMLIKLSMNPADFSLRDPHCKAVTNETHLVFRSEFGKCGMFEEVKKEFYTYVNEVLFIPHNGAESSGIAEDDDIGSGTLPDDEDVGNQQQTSVSEVRCKFPVGKLVDTNILNSDGNTDMKTPVTYTICSGSTCPRHSLQFTVSSTYSDPFVSATVSSCTISTLDGTLVNYPIIKNGCARLDGVGITRNIHETVQISTLPILDPSMLFGLSCEVAICSRDEKTSVHTLCPDRKKKKVPTATLR